MVKKRKSAKASASIDLAHPPEPSRFVSPAHHLGEAFPGPVSPEVAADSAVSDELERLRHQVTALQRISSIGILAGGICHELNNALTPIINYAKLGLRNPDPAYRERALRKILEGGERASTITRGMLGLARPGDRQGRRETIDLVSLLDEVVLLISKDLARNNVRLESEPAGRFLVSVNAPQIQQVLINLLINARQAMPSGGLVTLRLEADPTGHFAELSVVDRGGGISPDHLPRIFEPFFSTKESPDQSGLGGTGLGLAVCRDIVESHHGRIRVRSRPGEGSTFTLILPLATPPASVLPPAQGAA